MSRNPSPSHSAGLGTSSHPPPTTLLAPQPVASLTRAGTIRVGPRLGEQVEKHVAQKSPQGKAEQLFQAPCPSYKAEMQDLGTEARVPGLTPSPPSLLGS